MTVREAYEALGNTLLDIAKILEDTGLCCEVKNNLCGVDFDELEEERDGAALIYGEISFGEREGKNRGILECAVSVVDGEIAPEELRRELYDMRSEARRIAEIKATLGEGEDILSALEDSIEEEEAENAPEEDNPKAESSGKALKIIGGIAVLAVAAFTLVLLIIR